MPEELQDVNRSESSPELAEVMEEAAASEQQAQETQAPTAEQGVTQEPVEQQESQDDETRVPYARLKEVVDERNWYRGQMEQLISQRQNQLTNPNTPQTPQDPYAGMNAEEEKFWRMVDKRADKIAEQKLSQISPMLNTGIKEIAAMKVQQFRASHPDIKPNSPDEISIAQKIQQGYSTDDAYWSVMGPRGIRQAEQKAATKAKQAFQQKKQANVESSSVSQTVKPAPKKSFEEDLADEILKAENITF